MADPPKNSKFFVPLTNAVASGSTVKAAAEALGCSLTVAYSMSCSQEFKQRTAEIRSEALSATVGILSDGATKAAQTLVRLLDDEDPKVQLAAATKLLTNLQPMTELHELRKSVEELREQLQPKLAKTA
jgi:HEAT repeat protein